MIERDSDEGLTLNKLKNKARILIKNNFKASDGWAKKFIVRNNFNIKDKLSYPRFIPKYDLSLM